jgi:hypothetical protein
MRALGGVALKRCRGSADGAAELADDRGGFVPASGRRASRAQAFSSIASSRSRTIGVTNRQKARVGVTIGSSPAFALRQVEHGLDLLRQPPRPTKGSPRT